MKEPTLPKLISNNFRSSALIHSIMPKFDEKVKQSKMDPLLNCKNMIKELHIEYEFSQSMSDPLLNCKNMLKELHIEYEFSQSMSLIPKKKCY